MEEIIIELRSWFRTNGLMDFELFPNKIPKDEQGKYITYTCKEVEKQFKNALDKFKKLPIHSVINWVAFDFMKLETRPPKFGKYLITRKDGKIHWETWNGSEWDYNHNEIRYWAEIKPPCL